MSNDEQLDSPEQMSDMFSAELDRRFAELIEPLNRPLEQPPRRFEVIDRRLGNTRATSCPSAAAASVACTWSKAAPSVSDRTTPLASSESVAC